MMKLFTCDTADDAWLAVAEEFRVGDDVRQHSGRGGEVGELLHVAISISDPRQRWVLSRRPAMNPAFAIAEVVWIINGRNDSGFLNYWNPILPRYAGEGPTYAGAYGDRLRRHFGVDQLQRAYRALEHNPDSRQIVLQIWDCTVDLPDEKGDAADPDIPCNLHSMLKVRDGRLEWMQVMRSNDLILGLPHNIIQFTTLQEVMAGWLSVELGSYNHLSDSLHLYAKQREAVRVDQAIRVPDNPDCLSLPYVESQKVWAHLNSAMDTMRSHKLSRKNLQDIIVTGGLPSSYRNLLCVVAADTARRRGWEPEMNTAMGNCTNPLLRQLWQAWLDRRPVAGGDSDPH